MESLVVQVFQRHFPTTLHSAALNVRWKRRFDGLSFPEYAEAAVRQVWPKFVAKAQRRVISPARRAPKRCAADAVRWHVGRDGCAPPPPRPHDRGGGGEGRNKRSKARHIVSGQGLPGRGGDCQGLSLRQRPEQQRPEQRLQKQQLQPQWTQQQQPPPPLPPPPPPPPQQQQQQQQCLSTVESAVASLDVSMLHAVWAEAQQQQHQLAAFWALRSAFGQ